MAARMRDPGLIPEGLSISASHIPPPDSTEDDASSDKDGLGLGINFYDISGRARRDTFLTFDDVGVDLLGGSSPCISCGFEAVQAVSTPELNLTPPNNHELSPEDLIDKLLEEN